MSGPGEDPRLEEAVFGREVEEFLTNDRIGQYLVAQARKDSEEAATALLTAEPTDFNRIRELQFKGRLPAIVTQWLANAIQNGEAQALILQQERDENGGSGNQ